VATPPKQQQQPQPQPALDPTQSTTARVHSHIRKGSGGSEPGDVSSPLAESALPNGQRRTSAQALGLQPRQFLQAAQSSCE
jgi:hypothetical protein